MRSQTTPWFPLKEYKFLQTILLLVFLSHIVPDGLHTWLARCTRYKTNKLFTSQFGSRVVSCWAHSLETLSTGHWINRRPGNAGKFKSWRNGKSGQPCTEMMLDLSTIGPGRTFIFRHPSHPSPQRTCCHRQARANVVTLSGSVGQFSFPVAQLRLGAPN